MFQKNDVVRYGSLGIFHIQDIITKKMPDGTEKLCYVLHTQQTLETRIVTPVDNSKLRRVFNEGELQALIANMPKIEYEWIKDKKQREEFYQKALHSGDCMALIQVIKSIYLVKEEKEKKGKSISYTDLSVFQEAQRQLWEEVAYSAHIAIEDADAYIRNHIPSTL